MSAYCQRIVCFNLIGTLFLLTLLGGCQHPTRTPDGATLYPIRDKTWELVSLQGQAIDPTGERRPTLRLTSDEDGAVTGFAGCNRFSGNYLLVGHTLRLSRLDRTRMTCPRQDLEARYLSTLGEVSRYHTPDGSTLILLAGEEPLARLTHH